MAFCRRSPLSFVTAILLLSLTSPLPVAANPIDNIDIHMSPSGDRNILDEDKPDMGVAQAPPTNQDQKAEAMRLSQEGVGQLNQSQFAAALQKFQQALAIYQKIGESVAPPKEARKSEGYTLNNIGLVYRRQGEYSQALKFYQQALAILREVGDKDGERTTLYNLGVLHRKLGQYPQALEFLNQALAIFTDINDLRPIAGIERFPQQEILIAIGQVYESLGQTDKARDFYRQAAQLADELSKLPRMAALSFGEVSILRDDDDKVARAPITNQDQKAEAMQLYQSGVKQRNQRQFPAALAKFNQALTIYRAIGDQAGEARTLHKIGTVYFMMGKPRSGRDSFQKALEFFQQARAIYKQIGDRRGEAQTLNNIGAAYFRLRQPRTAVNFLRQAVAIYREIGDKAGEARAKKNLNAALASATGNETILIDDDDYDSQATSSSPSRLSHRNSAVVRDFSPTSFGTVANRRTNPYPRINVW